MSIHVQLERFEGPLALLLHLIRREEMDVFDINVQQITQQYLDYIKAMKKLDLEVAGEFVAMAATLIHIKSRMLLPQYGEDGEEISGDDPRRELVQKLLEYQKFQEVSAQLYERPLLGRDLWLRGSREDVPTDVEEEIIVEENPLFSLISSYRTAVRNMKKTVHKVMGELQSIASRILEMKDRLLVGERVKMHSLVGEDDKNGNQLLVTFLSMLELAKMGFVSLFQAENFSDIHISTKKVIDRDVINRVEDFKATEMDSELAKVMSDEIDMTEENEAEPESVEEIAQEAGQEEQMAMEMESSEDAIQEGASVSGESEAGDSSEGMIVSPATASFIPDDSFEVDAATDLEIEEEERRIDKMDGVS